MEEFNVLFRKLDNLRTQEIDRFKWEMNSDVFELYDAAPVSVEVFRNRLRTFYNLYEDLKTIETRFAEIESWDE